MSEDDPFEDLDVPEDREGDPFERLADAGPTESEAPADGEDDGDPDESALFTPDSGEAADSDETDGADLFPSDTSETAGSDETDGADLFTPESDDGEATGSVEPDESEQDTADGETADQPAFEEEYIDEDDPFARLDSGADEDHDTGTGSSAAEHDGDDPALDAGFFDEGDSDVAVSEDDPFTDMAGRDGDPFSGGESVFETVDVEGLDPDEVWESLEADETDGQAVHGTRYTDVSKHRFCEQCEFFSEPPAASCTHEEAEIMEFLDMEMVRLLNCPVVAEQRELENEE